LIRYDFHGVCATGGLLGIWILSIEIFSSFFLLKSQ